MTAAAPSPTEPLRGSYRNTLPYPFCPGCGHGPILDALDRALALRGLDPERVVIVSDIGCSGLSDQYFATGAFHGLHGRSLTYATGIKMVRPELTVVVILGDGGTGIGGAHLLNAARRNVGLTVLVMNNFNYGMTGGQHSATTPPGAHTATTPGGNLERPLDLCATVAVNGAAFAWRGTSFDPDLDERIAEALATPGFALLDVWELCTAHFVPANKASRRSLGEMREALGLAHGVVGRRQAPEYATAYRASVAPPPPAPGTSRLPAAAPRFPRLFDRRFELVVAGSAGGRVRSAARLLARAAVLSGLSAAQRDDYPVTVQTGFSVSELILAPGEIHWTGVDGPDTLVVLSADGKKKAAATLRRLRPGARVFAMPDQTPLDTAAEVTLLELGAGPSRLARGHQALRALAAVNRHLGLLAPEALEAAARQAPGERVDDLLEALGAGG